MGSFLTNQHSYPLTVMAEKTLKQRYIESKCDREDIILFIESHSGSTQQLIDQLGFTYIEYSTMLAHPRVFWGDLDEQRRKYGNTTKENGQ